MKRNICLTLGMVLATVAAKASVVNVHVVNARDGKPMANVPVSGTFEGILAFGHEYDERYFQKTDSQGYCQFTGTNNNPYAYISIFWDKPDYIYRTERKIMLNRVLDEEHKTPGDYHSVTLRVQCVGHRIPLYIKTASGGGFGNDFFGKGNDAVSYDMLIGDWLPPQGTGSVADVVFTRLQKEDLGIVTNLCREVHLYRDRLKVTFPGEGNGVVEVKPLEDSYLLVREAPAEGYQHEHMSYSGQDKDGVAVMSWYPYNRRAYCFRIRSKMNERGELTEGFYGKVHNGFMFDYVMMEDRTIIPVGTLDFEYYLNLVPLDRNLEWDEKNNLNPERR